MQPILFQVEKSLESTLGRAGVLSTLHGNIYTPAFLPVGTNASVKSLLPDIVSQLGAQGVLSNTYHLYLEPGEDVIESVGGLHAFMNWNGPIMTDSGGFQVFSLGEAYENGISKVAIEDISSEDGLTLYNDKRTKEVGRLAIIDEDGVTFTSHRDGSMHRFTPERSIEIQHALGADIIVAFDECTSPLAKKEYQKEAMDRTHRWAKRSLIAHKHNFDAVQKQGIYGVVQGGRYLDLRSESARILNMMDFDGFGIGGSFSKHDLRESLTVVTELLDPQKPRHLLGIGDPFDIFEGVERGCDTFDCVAPTREARNGRIYTKEGFVNIRNAKYKHDHTLLSLWNPYFGAATYTRSYLHHLFRTNEILGCVLASMINISFMTSFVEQIRTAILEERYSEYKEKFTELFKKAT